MQVYVYPDDRIAFPISTENNDEITSENTNNICLYKYAEKIMNAPNFGGTIGKLCAFFVNGIFNGVRNYSIPKDENLFGMSLNGNEWICSATGGMYSTNTSTYENYYEIEELGKTTNSETVYNTIANFINTINTATQADFITAFNSVGNIREWLGYMCLIAFINDFDGITNNIILHSFDGEKIGISAWDMDSTMGNDWNAIDWQRPRFKGHALNNLKTNNIMNKIIVNAKSELINAWNTLRQDVLTTQNLYAIISTLTAFSKQQWYDEEHKTQPLRGKTTSSDVFSPLMYISSNISVIDAEMNVL